MGLLNNDDVTAQYSTAANSLSAVGIFPVTVTLAGIKALNYTLTATLSVLVVEATLEAEHATLVNGVEVSSQYDNHSGPAYVQNFDNIGAAVSFNVNVATDGKYNVVLGYGNSAGPSYQMDYYVNGQKINTNLVLLSAQCHYYNPNCGNQWNTYMQTLSLNAGNNVIKFERNSNTGNVRLDYMKITPNTALIDLSDKYEAENAVLANGVEVSNLYSNYSGSGYVQGFSNSNSSVFFNVSVPETGKYDVTLAYGNSYGPSYQMGYYLNGQKIQSDLVLGNSQSSNTWNTHNQTLTLNAGTNVIKFQTETNTGNVRLDYIKVAPYLASNETAREEAKLEEEAKIAETPAKNTSSIQIYPSPSSGTFTVNASEDASYTISSLEGKVVYTGTLSQGSNRVEIESLASGVYSININGKISKLMIEK